MGRWGLVRRSLVGVSLLLQLGIISCTPSSNSPLLALTPAWYAYQRTSGVCNRYPSETERLYRKIASHTRRYVCMTGDQRAVIAKYCATWCRLLVLLFCCQPAFACVNRWRYSGYLMKSFFFLYGLTYIHATVVCVHPVVHIKSPKRADRDETMHNRCQFCV